MVKIREITYVRKTKEKKIFQLSEKEFREGKWCADTKAIPNGDMVELSFTARNGILIVHNTTDLDVKKLKNKSVKEGESDE